MGSITQTDLGYTGQRDLAGMGLMDYKARLYDSSIGRFIQPDSIIPNPADPQSWNRFSYVLNAPITLTDPTGHKVDEGCGTGSKACVDLPKKYLKMELRRHGDETNRVISPEELSRYRVIATEQLARYTMLYQTTSQEDDPFLKDLYNAETGLWTAIVKHQDSKNPLMDQNVQAEWIYYEAALSRAEINGYFGEERKYWALLENYDPDTIFIGQGP